MDAQISHGHTLYWTILWCISLIALWYGEKNTISNNERIARHFKNTPAHASYHLLCFPLSHLSLVPRPNVTQLRVDYVTARYSRSGDVIHPLLHILWYETSLIWPPSYRTSQTIISNHPHLLCFLGIHVPLMSWHIAAASFLSPAFSWHSNCNTCNY